MPIFANVTVEMEDGGSFCERVPLPPFIDVGMKGKRAVLLAVSDYFHMREIDVKHVTLHNLIE